MLELELVRKKKLGTQASGLRPQAPTIGMSRLKNGSFSTHTGTLYTVRLLYTATRVTFLAAKKKINTHAQDHAMFDFYSF